MFAIRLESLTSFKADNVNNLDFDDPQGWARYPKVGD
jgi:hypothetical protein